MQNKALIIGDSLSTDIYGGNQFNLLTVLVLPLSKYKKYNNVVTMKDLFNCYGFSGVLYYRLLYNN